jgi:hypothetical protein
VGGRFQALAAKFSAFSKATSLRSRAAAVPPNEPQNVGLKIISQVMANIATKAGQPRANQIRAKRR